MTDWQEMFGYGIGIIRLNKNWQYQVNKEIIEQNKIIWWIIYYLLYKTG